MELKLIEFNEKYLEDLYEYSSKKEFHQFMQYAPDKNIEDTRKYWVKKINEDNSKVYLVKNISEEKVIGSVVVSKIDLTNLSCNIGYALNPEYWGRGYLKIILIEAEIKVSTSFGLERIEAVTMKENTPSRKGLLSAGYVEVGIIPEYYKFKTKRSDAALYSKILKK